MTSSLPSSYVMTKMLCYHYVIFEKNKHKYYFLDNSIHLILIIIRVKIPPHQLVEILEYLKLVQIIPFIQIYQSSPVYRKEIVTNESYSVSHVGDTLLTR